MKPAPFQYEVPKSVNELELILSSPDFDGQILAGGQTLLQLMNMRKVKPKKLVDINQIKSFHYIEDRGNELAIGPLVRHQELYTSPQIGRLCPMLKQAAGLIGHRAIRNRGTAVGSVAQSDPTQEIPTVMAALGGKVVLRDGLTHGDHIYDFFDYLQLKSRDQLKPYHYIREIRLPKISPGEGDAFQEFAPRQNDPPIVSVAVRLTANSSGKIVELEGAVAGLKPVPVRFKHENLFFSVQDENKACFEELTQLVMGTVLQADGPEASSHFNRNLVKALLVTSLKEAYHQAQANEKEGA